ncbi:MAG: hypothetical protein FJ291_24870, partial [Planctomycetes bacterium]|nr:hypothetical protein [Planctomycetota bacterium]
MPRIVQGLIFILGLTSGALSAEPGLRGPRPYDGRGEDPGAERIEWKESWEATYKANVERWTAEVRKLAGDERERGLLLRTRVARLLDALIARYPNESAKRLEALKEIAGNYYACELPGRGNYALKRLVEETPGQVDLVAAALHRILAERNLESHYSAEEWPAWVDYAAPRLVALNRAGNLPDGHPAIVAAWRALLLVRREQGRFLEAMEALEALEAHTGRNDAWLLEEAELLFAAGREREALPRFQDLHSRSDQNYRARDRVTHILTHAPAIPPSYASQFGLEIKWDAIRASPPGDVADRIADLLREDAEGKAVLPWKDVRHASLWAQLDRHLLAQPPAALATLRAAQESRISDFRSLISDFNQKSAISNQQFTMCLAAYRRHPWAASAHRLLLAYGEGMLRNGHGGLALRAFQDVLAHAADPALRSQAQAGLSRISDFGSRISDFNPQSAALRLPPIIPWQWELFSDQMPQELTELVWPGLVRPQACPAGVLVAGPELLALYGQDPQKPLWTRTPSGSRGRHGRLESPDTRVLVIPAPVRPAVAEGRVYTRWGMDATRRFFTDVAAFDLRSGELLWSTGGNAAWGDLWPVGDPAVAYGRLYVLALRKGYAGLLPVSTLSLACLDAATGAILWRKPLASQNVTLIPTDNSNYRDWQFDLAHYGNAVTVADGAVYCQTNLGFAARCDARDGQVEWAASYPQTVLRWNVPRAIRRHGAAPAVCGDRVVFVPRDASGAFALDAPTGKLLWDNPFAPSDRVVGVHEGTPSVARPSGAEDSAAERRATLLVADERVVAGLDVATGRARWRRHFPNGIQGSPCLQGTRVSVGSGSKLLWLEAATGRLLEISDFRSPISDFNPQSEIRNPKSVGGPLRLPLARAWKLARPNPTLLTPPPEAKLDGKLLLISRGVLECVRATPQGGVEWQRGIQPGFQATLWAEGTLFLVYPRSVAAIDTATGQLRWHTEVPFRIRQWQEALPYLVLGDFTELERGKRACALDAASGRLLWSREFREMGMSWDDIFHGIGWDGKSVHFIASFGQHVQGGGHFDVVCDPADGRIAALRRFLPRGRQWPFLFDVGEGFGFFVDQDKVGWDFALDGSPHTRYAANLRDLDPQHERFLRRTRTRRRLQTSEQWVQVHQQEGYPRFHHTHWVLKRGDPAYELRRTRPGVIRGNTLYEIDEQSLRIVDLPSRKDVAHLRIVLPAHRQARILDWLDEGDTVLVVSGIERGPYASAMTPYRMQVDAFERATGRHLARQFLDDLPYWRFAVYRDWRDHRQHESQVAWAPGMLFLTDAEGLVALQAAAAPEAPQERPIQVAHRAATPIAIDGWLDDIGQSEIRNPKSEIRDSGGSVRLAHDATNLYIALSHPAPTASQRRGAGAYGEGDWLEVAIAAGEATRRFTLGADERGHPAWGSEGKPAHPPLSDRPVLTLPEPTDARGAIRHDLAGQRLIYELALPLKQLIRPNESPRWRRLRLSLAAWHTPPGGQPERVLSWGNPWWADSILAERHETIYLHPLTTDGEAAGLAIAHELPEVYEAWDFFEDSCELRARQRPSRILADSMRDYLKRHPTGLPAERAILALDRALRNGLENDPTAEVVRIAQEAGVPEPIRARYARLAKAYISLWLHTDPARLPAGLMVQFNDGRERSGWHHRVVWGIDRWYDSGEPGTPSHQYAGQLPHADGWQELRIPLVWIGLQDKPLCGIAFTQFGGGRLVWDRCAVVWDGGERVFLDDDPPKAKELAGQWAWVTEPRKSGARAHTVADPGGPSDTVHHGIFGFEAPVYEHLIPPATGAVLSQWVYLDPAKPPRTIALNIQARGDPSRVLWGRPEIEGRYMGPLPAPGQWHELRVPLSWTPYAAWPIRGLLFEDVAGRAFWDRTAIVRDGQEHVLIEDAMPEGSPKNDWHWVEKPAKSGKRAHMHPPEDGYEEHGVFYLTRPFTQHLAFDPIRAGHVLQEQIPRLGPTDAAWRFSEVLRDMPPFAQKPLVDRVRWFFSVIPDHPQNITLLKYLLNYYDDVKDPAPLAAVEKEMEASKLPKAL